MAREKSEDFEDLFSPVKCTLCCADATESGESHRGGGRVERASTIKPALRET
jgi:hypothetical protein